MRACFISPKKEARRRNDIFSSYRLRLSTLKCHNKPSRRKNNDSLSLAIPKGSKPASPARLPSKISGASNLSKGQLIFRRVTPFENEYTLIFTIISIIIIREKYLIIFFSVINYYRLLL